VSLNSLLVTSQVYTFDLESSLILTRTRIQKCARRAAKLLSTLVPAPIVGPQEDVDQIHDAMNAKEFFLHRYTVSFCVKSDIE
jgi:hypothetical protein